MTVNPINGGHVPEKMDGVEDEIAYELQAGLDDLNEADPPSFYSPHFIANPRHECTGARQAEATGKGVSTAIDTKECYVTGWEKHKDPLTVKPLYDETAKVALIYRQGRCKKCKNLTRSEVGRVVLVDERPPSEGRMARE